MGIKYFTSRVTYTCDDCVKTKTDGYEDVLNLINSLGASENDADDVSTQHGEPAGQLDHLIKTVSDMKVQMDRLSNKLVNETQQHKSKSYSDAVRDGKESPKMKSNSQVVFVKCKEGTNRIDEDELVSALKTVPTITVKKVQEKSVKVILPNDDAKDKALTALAESTKLSETHVFSPEKKLKPKITISYVPRSIEDEDIVQLITEKNNQISDLVDQGHTMKVLFSKNSTTGFKTVILAVSPQIRKVIRDNQDYVYINLSRCKVFDHFWVLRCGNCLAYGHKTTHCRRENPNCGYCSGQHRSSDCTQKEQQKCIHCVFNSRDDASHSAFSTKCPSFLIAKQNLIRKTIGCEDEGRKN
ncbi:hypothetical protein Pcinc_044037 [Petrolisthes cinctipes]|uniref:Gag-like protein n=1 Tax=Petrolisthes cinctipes TaxID=88211 RepID=A0AAE1EFR3_PETCI|nr:hypothetical protein Pcinc_044037 [Petrolisthes cinctipes]